MMNSNFYINQKELEFYDKYYSIIADGLLNNSEMIYLGDPSNRKCRFCGKSEINGANFAKVAHAFPESIGNQCLATYYECDKCNERFGKYIENHYANYMNFYHTISQIKGKKKVPQHLSKSQHSKLRWENDIFVLTESTDDIHTTINVEKKELIYSSETPSHIPMAVYKCFIKMALTIMPENELAYYKETIDWISEKKHENIFNGKKLLCRYKMIPGYNVIKYPHYCLFKRKMNSSLAIYPHMIFNITYGIFTFALEVPTKNETGHSINNVKFPPIPFPTTSSGIMDLSSTEIQNDVKQQISFNFGSAKELDPTDPNLKELL